MDQHKNYKAENYKAFKSSDKYVKKREQSKEYMAAKYKSLNCSRKHTINFAEKINKFKTEVYNMVHGPWTILYLRDL